MAQKYLHLGNVHACGCLQKYCDNLLQVIKLCLKDVLTGHVIQVHLFYLSSVSQTSVPVVTESHRSLYSSCLKLAKVDFQESPTTLLHFLNITKLEMRKFITEAVIDHCMVT